MHGSQGKAVGPVEPPLALATSAEGIETTFVGWLLFPNASEGPSGSRRTETEALQHGA